MPLTSRIRVWVSGHVRFQTCAGIRNSLLGMEEFYCIPYETLKEGTRVSNVPRFVRERAYFLTSPFYEIDHLRTGLRKSHPLDHPDEFSSLDEGKSRVVAASVVNARLYWRICATEAPLYGKKGTNPPPDLATRSFFLFAVASNSTVFDECIFHYAYCCVLHRRDVPRVRSSMDKYVIRVGIFPSLRIYSRVSRLSFEKRRKERSPNIEKAVPSLHL